MAAQRIYDLRGRVCLVTGATSGIGRETAQGLAQSGATVLLVARDHGRGAEVAAEIQSTRAAGSVELLIADLACQGDVRALAGEIRQGHDRLDVLIHNAAARLVEQLMAQVAGTTSVSTERLERPLQRLPGVSGTTR